MKHLVPVGFAVVCGLVTYMNFLHSVHGAIGIYNSSEACLLGSGKTLDFKIDCSITPTPGLISVRRMLHGLTPLSMKCIGFAPASSCCPGYNRSRDCLFPTYDGVANLRSKCDGFEACELNIARVVVGDACPARAGGSLNYSTYSYFSVVEYSCIGTENMVDVCASTLNITAKELYLEANIYHTNTAHFNKTCSCVVSTQCGHSLIFHAYDLVLSKDAQGQCLETVMLSDSHNDSVSANLSCNDNGAGVKVRVVEVGEVEGSVFVSQSNVVEFGLQLLSTNKGKMLIRVTASGGVPVEVRCGEARDQTPPQNQNCLAVTTESTSSTTTAGTAISNTAATTKSSTAGISTTTEVSGTPKGYNTSHTCLMGRGLNPYVEIDCTKTPNQGHIYVTRIFHGAPPNSTYRCNITSPASECCPGYDKSRDCLIVTDEGLEKLRKRCDGLEKCSVQLDRAAVEGQCPARQAGSVTYPQYSSFAVVEYTCINTGLLSDVCAIGNTKRGAALYLETNVYNNNKGHANKTCPCTISTQCGHRLVFHAYDLDLAKDTQGQCKETVFLADESNSSISTNFSCNDNGYGEGHRTAVAGEVEGSVFVSQGSVVHFQFQLQGSNEGTMLIRVTATDSASVEVRCGSTAEQGVWKEHQCPTTTTAVTTTTTPPFTTPELPTTTASLEYDDKTAASGSPVNRGEPNGLDSAVIAGVIVAAVIICLVIIALALLIWRSRRYKRHREDEPITETDSMGALPENPPDATPETAVSASHVYDVIPEAYSFPTMNGGSDKHVLYDRLHGNHPSVVLTTAGNDATATYTPPRSEYARLFVDTDSVGPLGAEGGIKFENPMFFSDNGLNQFKEEKDKRQENM